MGGMLPNRLEHARMTFRKLILQSLRFHWRAHLGVVLGAIIASAALIGALVVGDSVRESLRQLALQRLGWVHLALESQERFFRQELARFPELDIGPSLPDRVSEGMGIRTHDTSVLLLRGTVARSYHGNMVTQNHSSPEILSF